MSRVYDTPRYRNQTLSKVLLILDTKRGDVLDHRSWFATEDTDDMRPSKLAFTMGLLGMDSPELDECIGETKIDDRDLFRRYCYVEGLLKGDIAARNYFRRSADVIYSILTPMVAKGLPIFTDDKALSRLVCKYISGDYKATCSRAVTQRRQLAASLANDVCTAGTAACRLGEKVRKLMTETIIKPYEGCAKWVEMQNWHEACEKMRLSGVTPDVQEGHAKLRDGGKLPDASKFRTNETYAGRNLGCMQTYRIMGLCILRYHDAVYILDYSAMDQFYCCAKFWEGSYSYCSNYHLSGTMDTIREDMMEPLQMASQWVRRSAVASNYSTSLPRSMKQSISILHNNFHNHSEVLEVRAGDRLAILEEIVASVVPLPVYWHTFIDSLQLSDRAKLDLANLYYGFPAPDADIEALWAKGADTMNNARTADKDFMNGLMNYRKALDFCKYVCRHRKAPNHIAEPGYLFEGKGWYKQCMKGSLRLPPDDELGKVYIFAEFSFIDTVSDWAWSAADVTHINADMGQFSNARAATEIRREIHNELLYALNYAPFLSEVYTPDDLYEELASDHLYRPRIAGQAAKSENTKPGEKVRETWSGDDCTRELTTCFDTNAQPLASYYNGVVSRAPSHKVDAIFDRIAHMAVKGKAKAILILSNDVSGWSTSGDRSAWAAHHDYVVQTTKCPPGFSILRIWNKITAVLFKRGFLNAVELTDGLFQGWTGTCDSLLNVALSLYCVKKGKDLGYLDSSEAANTAGLIDDALQGIELSVPSTDPRAQEAADKHLDTSIEVWDLGSARLAFEKTIYSSIKFIFLNRFYCEGTEVLLAMKVFARANRDLKRRFTGVMGQFDTIMGSFRSASKRGGDPFVCYYSGVYRCFELAIQAAGDLKNMAGDALMVCNAFFAPRSMGGWGLPHIIGWLTQECQDKLTMYLGVMTSLHDVLVGPITKGTVNRIIHTTLGQEVEPLTALGVLSDPFSYRCKGVSSVEGIVLARVKEAMKSKAKSQMFRDALELGDGDNLEDEMMAVLESVTSDATILQLLGDILPTASVQALIDRAYRNELTAQLLPFQVKTRLSSQIRSRGRLAIMHLLAIPLDDNAGGNTYTRAVAFDTAYSYRERVFAGANLSITNHTLPDYGSCLCRVSNHGPYSVSVHFSGLVSHCKDHGKKEGYLDMYNGQAATPKLRAPVSAGIYTFTGEGFKGLTPPKKAMQKMVITAAHITHMGGDGNEFLGLASATWGMRERPPAASVAIKHGVSVKRIGTERTHRAHDIAAFSNTHSAVQVDANPIGGSLSSTSTQLDYMSIVTAIRAMYILEVAAHNANIGPLNYGLLPGTFVLTVPNPFKVNDRDLFNESLNNIISGVPAWVEDSANRALVEDNAPGADEDVVVVPVFPGVERGVSEARARVLAGGLAALINVSFAIPTSTGRRTRQRRANAEEVSSYMPVTSATRYRRYLEKFNRSSASLMIFIDCIVENIHGEPEKDLLAARWADVGTVFARVKPKWEVGYTCVRNCMSRMGVILGEEEAHKLFGSIRLVKSFMRPNKPLGPEDAQICAIAYLTGHGRAMIGSVYTLTAAMGPRHISRLWWTAYRKRAADEGRDPRAVTDRVLSCMYRSVSISAKAFTSKLALMDSMVNGLADGLENENRRPVLPRPTDAMITVRSARLDFVSRVADAAAASFRTLDRARIFNDLNNVSGDIAAIGEAPAQLTEEPLLMLSDAPNIEALIGETVREAMAEEAMEVDDVIGGIIEGSGSIPMDHPAIVRYGLPRVRAAAAEWQALGASAARNYLVGNTEGSGARGFEVEDDEVTEFLENVMCEDEDEGRMGEEVEL